MAAIEAVFENNGYEIVCPELLTFADQVAAVVSAQHGVAEEGSALHLCDILGPQDSSLTVLSRRGPNARYWQRYLSPRVQTFRAFDSVVPLHDYFGHQAHSSYALMNPSVAAEFLVGLGLQLDRAVVVDAIAAATMQDLRDLGLQFPS